MIISTDGTIRTKIDYCTNHTYTKPSTVDKEERIINQ